MSDDHFPVTVWPGFLVPARPVYRHPAASVVPSMTFVETDQLTAATTERVVEGPLIDLGNPNTWERADVPPELYLRQARDIDPLEADALCSFVRDVGGVLLNSMVDTGSGPRDIGDAQGAERRRFAARNGRAYPPRNAYPTGDFGNYVAPDDVAYRLKVLDVLGRHLVAYREGEYLAPVWTEHTVQPSRSEDEAWSRFIEVVNRALGIWHVRVERRGFHPSPELPTFLEVGALQIVNDLTEQVDYMTCPNCSRTFARQVGAGTQHVRRAGVTYCTPACATSVRVRAYRARKRAEKSTERSP